MDLTARFLAFGWDSTEEGGASGDIQARELVGPHRSAMSLQYTPAKRR
jgi:hypothetical protein